MLGRDATLFASVLSARKIYESWGRSVIALRDVSVEIPGGCITSIVGTNGSGKTTLLRAIGNLISLDGGRVEFNNRELSKLTRRAIARLVGFLHQAPLRNLCENFSMDEMVRTYLDRFGRSEQRDVKERILALELPLHRTVRSLSGGQQQLVALELVLARRPKILLLDEPTASLDVRHSRSVLARVVSARDEGITVVFVSHKLEEGLGIADKLIFMHDGRFAQCWTKEEVRGLDAETLRELMHQTTGDTGLVRRNTRQAT